MARIAAHRGELELARGLTESNLPLTESQPVLHSADDGVFGLVEPWSGRPGEAVARFAAADGERRVSGVNEPAMFWWRAEYAEALLALGRVDDAAALAAAWEAEAARLGREHVLAQVTRCHGLVAAARGDVDEAQEELARAVARHEAVGDEFGRARALLALGPSGDEREQDARHGRRLKPPSTASRPPVQPAGRGTPAPSSTGSRAAGGSRA